jgi:broad specificity phosphatase PhoE
LRNNPGVPSPCCLVRHGQSEWNVLQLTQGQTVSPRLTGRGRDQARQAAELIRADLAASGRRVEVPNGAVARIHHGVVTWLGSR